MVMQTHDPLATEGERRRDLRAALYAKLRVAAEMVPEPPEELKRVLADIKALDGSIE